MDENVVSSKKINLQKKIKLAWGVVAALLVLAIIISFVTFLRYRKGQAQAVTYMLAVTNSYNAYKSNPERMIQEMYDDLNPTRIYGIPGLVPDNQEVVSSARAADRELGRLMETAGYDCFYGSEYLAHTGFVDYTIHKMMALYIAWGVLAVALFVFNRWYISDLKKVLIIDAERIICKNGKKIEKEFLVKDVKSVETVSLKGILLRGNSIKYKINLLENADEIKTTILDTISAVPVENVITTEIKQEVLLSSADEIAKYKVLLDNGAITQEEFEAKKKQLLDL